MAHVFEYSKFPESIHSALKQIEGYDISFVWERMQMEGLCYGKKREIVDREFRRFLGIIAVGVRPLAMVGPLIDEVWHHFILFTSEYSAFCETVFGRMIHHTPNVASRPVPVCAWSNFTEAYDKYFGVLPDVWKEDMDFDALSYLNGSSVPPLKWSGWVGD